MNITDNINPGGWTSSNLGRTLDLSYWSNLAIVLITVLAGAVMTITSILRGSAMIESLLNGGRTGLYLFLCWGITREIDPDHEGSAFLATAFGAASLFIVDPPTLLPGFWLLGIMRVINRTTGKPITYLDTIILTAASLWMLWKFDLALGLIAGLAFLLDGQFDRRQIHQRIVGLLLLGLSAVFFVLKLGTFPSHELTPLVFIFGIVGGVVMIPLLWGSRELKSFGDYTKVSLETRRVQATQLTMIAAAVILFSRSGDGLASSLVEWETIFGAGIWYLGVRALQAIRSLAPTSQ